MENPIRMDDLGVPLFLETPISVPHGGPENHFSNDSPEANTPEGPFSGGHVNFREGGNGEEVG